ncbi:pyridoxal phosphate-dependent aminotransferase [Gordonia jinhuaensis]|uniref:Pyridoxal phosphate-dependent aminotransferase n=2 Tax=Gordonia jinhuaensis TaxID=1517702 RepID=A0A916WTX8_9ACTN|nr:pyridoxal phosphate-dependent aminotransferase [Gordonia jinhuaensis]
MSGIRRLFEVALRMDDVTVLAVGEPDVAVAPHIAAAACAAWERDDTDYAPNGGIAKLRSAITEKLQRDNHFHADVEQVWVTVGATQALYQAMTLLLGVGEEILVPDPGYTTFTMNARMIGAIPVPYPLRPETHHGTGPRGAHNLSHADHPNDSPQSFLPDLTQLERLVTERTRAIILNSPSNPLGVVYPRAMIERLVDFAARHDLWIISDEVYEYFTYGRDHVSPASIDTDDRVFSVYSLSKTYAMTGVRVGYLVTPKGLGATMSTVQEAAISCVAVPDQYAGLAAITGPQDAVTSASDKYRANLNAATALLDSRGIGYARPQGAFYLWVDISYASEGDVAGWAEKFLLDTRIAVAPGSAFGRSGEGWIRVCVAVDRDDLMRGLAALPAP